MSKRDFARFFPCFRGISAPFRLMGTPFSIGLTKGSEAVQVMRQVFQADLDFRAAEAFRKDLSALVCLFAHHPEHVFDTDADSRSTAVGLLLLRGQWAVSITFVGCVFVQKLLETPRIVHICRRHTVVTDKFVFSVHIHVVFEVV